MKVVIGAVALIAAIAVGCGGGPAGSASKEASDTTSGQSVVDETGDVVDATAASVGDAEMEDRNQELADQYAAVAPKNLAAVCQGMNVIGEDKSQKMMGRILGEQIIRQGGDVDEVVDLLLDRC